MHTSDKNLLSPTIQCLIYQAINGRGAGDSCDPRVCRQVLSGWVDFTKSRGIVDDILENAKRINVDESCIRLIVVELINQRSKTSIENLIG